MESLYYVMCWACHRRCRHCYETRFRPYVREALEKVIAEAEASFPRIIDHLPQRMTYLDPLDRGPDGQPMVPRGDNRYHAIFGGGPALFVSPSSLAPASLASCLSSAVSASPPWMMRFMDVRTAKPRL